MDLQLLFTLFSTFLLLFYMFLKHAKNYYSSKDTTFTPQLPPGPRKLPIIGNLLQLNGSLPHHSLRNMAKKHGPIMHIKLGQITAIIISSAAAAKEIMKTHDLNFSDRPRILASDILFYNSTGIISSNYGNYLKMLRKICRSELLGTKRVESFRSIREDEAQNLIRSILSFGETSVNLTEKFFSMTNCITSRAAFGQRCKQQGEFIELMKKITTLLSGFAAPDLFPSFKLLHLISRVKPALQDIHCRLDKILDGIIAEHRAERSIEKSGVEDLVHVLLKLQESSDLDLPITTNNIKAIILDIFLAGTETSSTSLDWAMSEIMKNPRVMHKAQAEVRHVFKGKNKIQETEIEQLHYLKMVIKETLRLHPPGPLLLPREARQKCEIKGYLVPSKSKIIVNAWAIGRDENHWKNAETFEPQRFQGSSIDFRGTDFEFIPFGAGRRACPGMSFGIANIELPLAQLLYHFNWKIGGGVKPEELDMTEAFGAAVRRRDDLHLIATPFII